MSEGLVEDQWRTIWEMTELTPRVLLHAYASGLFPMAEGRNDSMLYWVDPDKRGILPLDKFHVSRRLARTVRQDRFQVTVDSSFEEVIRSCAEPQSGRESTWINDEIIALYCTLNLMGRAHSIECRQEGHLVGGLYGVSLGAAFFGESMFSRATDASKVALVHLVARLRHGGFQLLDAQFLTEHLERFGAIEIPRAEYKARLAAALEQESDFYSLAPDSTGGVILQSITQTS